MEKITSFTINHNELKKGIYLSRVDRNVYTYDLRFKEPNKGDYVSISAMHTIEHLFATVVRNSRIKDNVVYFGPMGCRTGFYLLLFDIKEDEVKDIVIECLEKCLELNEIPGSKKIECGNYKSHNLRRAKEEISKYLSVIKG
ncbi:MAG: S-ribosylhomocysteine lyase [Clostridia bacterium]|nr:S-ribosylhomocysteine lyase [Clostridia bacterium]